MDQSICRFMPVKNYNSNLKTINFVYETELHTLRQPFFHHIYRLCIVKSGSGVMKTGNMSFELKEGTLWLNFAGTFSEIEATEDFKFIYISFMGTGVPEMLEKLKSKGKIISLCTSKPEIYARQILEHFDLIKYFDHICGATMDGTRSLKTDVVTYAVETCGITDKSEAVMVGDRHHDIEGGKANGLPTVGVLFGYGSREELTGAGADMLASTVSELYDILKGE